MTRAARRGSAVAPLHSLPARLLAPALLFALALLLSLPVLLLLVASATAAFPGTDGRLAYTVPVQSAAGISYRLETAYAVIRGVHTPAGVSLSETAVDRGGDSFDPAWAADGRTLAFASTRSASAQIYLFQLSLTGGVVPLCGLEICQLTHDPGGAYAPAFSTDQQRIAYTGISAGLPQIFTMTASGGDVRQLTSQGANQEPAFSPAGIVFASNRSGRFQLYLMNAEGGEVRQLTNQSANNIQPALSPDGSEIAYTHRQGSRSQVFLLSLAGGTPRQLTRSSSDSSLPAFSPDGAAILLTHGPSLPAEPSGALPAQAAPSPVPPPSASPTRPPRSSPTPEWAFDLETIDARTGAPLALGVPPLGFNGDWAPLPVPATANSAATPPAGTIVAQPISGHVTVSPGHTAPPSTAAPEATTPVGSTLHNQVEVPANSTYNTTRGTVRLRIARIIAPGRTPQRHRQPAPGSPPQRHTPSSSGSPPQRHAPPSPGSPPSGAPNPASTTSVTEATVSGGRFALLQRSPAAVPVIHLLAGPLHCAGARAALAGSNRRRRVKLRTIGPAAGRGRHGKAHTKSTIWEIEETCRGTVYRSIRDAVLVTDPAHHRTVVLQSGQHYLVRP